MNATLIGNTNAELQMTYFLTFKKLKCLDFPGFLLYKLIFKYQQLHSILIKKILHGASRLITSTVSY